MVPQTSAPLPYTANPLLLMANDLVLAVQITFTWPITAGLLGTVLPLFPMRSGPLDELACTTPNLWAIFLHTILIFAQLGFLVSLFPLAIFGLPLTYFGYVVGFVFGNQWFSGLINGPRRKDLFVSHSDCVRGHQPKHEKEKWVFINGISVGDHWLQSNLDLLAMTFRRPVYGIHNQTRGIIFDVLECIIQRDLGYATTDIRMAYAALTKILADKKFEKVVLILHSQGGIEGGLVLDWLYDTVAAEQLSKLEIYTFGNAANHWNAPIISSKSSAARTSTTNPSDVNGESVPVQRIVKHIEHYANEGEYVSKFGVLHFRPDQLEASSSSSTGPATDKTRTSWFVPKFLRTKASTHPQLTKLKTHSKSLSRSQTWTTSPQTPIEQRDSFQKAFENNRFFGTLFKRAASGHLLNMHYLDTMFQMKGLDPNDRSKGEVEESNTFMDVDVDMAVYKEWRTVQAEGEDNQTYQALPSVEGPRNREVRKQVKDLSRLWKYRNGKSPSD